MTDEQNKRLDMARAEAGRFFDTGDVTALRDLALDLYRDAGDAPWNATLDGYCTALVDEADMILDSVRFLEAEWRMTNGEAVAHG